MKRRPQSWIDRFLASLEAHPTPALEEWRWARRGEDPVDPRAVEAAWDLATLHASAEANKLHHAMLQMETPEQKTLLPALVIAGARQSEVGAFRVFDVESKGWFPRDMAFVPGREHLEPDLELRCLVEVGRTEVDFLVWRRHRGFLTADEEGKEHLEVTAERTMAILLDEGGGGPTQQREDRYRDIELQQEGHLVVRVDRSDLWQDPIGAAAEALRTLTESARFDCEARMAEMERG